MGRIERAVTTCRASRAHGAAVGSASWSAAGEPGQRVNIRSSGMRSFLYSSYGHEAIRHALFIEIQPADQEAERADLQGLGHALAGLYVQLNGRIPVHLV